MRDCEYATKMMDDDVAVVRAAAVVVVVAAAVVAAVARMATACRADGEGGMCRLMGAPTRHCRIQQEGAVVFVAKGMP